MNNLKTRLYKFFIVMACLIDSLTLLSQVITHEDSLDNEFDIKVQAMLGNDLKGETMPDFVIRDKNGTEMSINKLRSKVTFINFWFESCPACIAQLQALEKFYVNNKPKADFQFVSITFEPDFVIEQIRKEKNLTYPIYHLSADSCKQLKFKMGYPAILIVGRNLRIVYSTAGGSDNPVNADKQLNHFIQAELDKHLKLPEIKVYE